MKSIAELEEIREKTLEQITLKSNKDGIRIVVGMATCGIAAGARTIMNTVIKMIEDSKRDDIIVTTSGCAGFCSKEPMATVETVGEAPVRYISLTEEKMRKIFSEHVVAGKPVKEYALVIGHETTY